MKNTFIIFLFCFSSFFLRGQYRKMPLDTNHYWQQICGRLGSTPNWECVNILKVKRDTIFNGKIFKYVESENEYCNQGKSFHETGLIRDDTLSRIVTFIDGEKEKILYNFNKNAGDTAMMYSQDGTFTLGGMRTFTIFAKDSVLINDGLYHKRLLLSPDYGIIEGVGGRGGLFRIWQTNHEFYYILMCLAQINPGLSIYSSLGIGASCPNTIGISTYLKNNNELSIYPNPSTDFIKIDNESLNIKSVYIISVLGQTILNFSNINSNSTDINISDLPTGLYFIKVNYESSFVTRQLIKN